MARATESKTERKAPRDRLYGDTSPDDIDDGRQEEPEEKDKGANHGGFERGKSQPGAREQHKKREQVW
ncbi:MAG: hypothetical protein ACE15E_10210 [Acidobacteriota bacterium]